MRHASRGNFVTLGPVFHERGLGHSGGRSDIIVQLIFSCLEIFGGTFYALTTKSVAIPVVVANIE